MATLRGRRDALDSSPTFSLIRDGVLQHFTPTPHLFSFTKSGSLTLQMALYLLICTVCDLELVIYKYLSETQFSLCSNPKIWELGI